MPYPKAYPYPDIPDFPRLTSYLTEYARTAVERGVDPAGALATAESALQAAIVALRDAPAAADNLARQPSGYADILALRPDAPRKLWKTFDEAAYADRLEGALLGRIAGCTLGAPVEFWSMERMEKWAAHNGDDFPPTDYWLATPEPYTVRYGVSPCSA
ncbi:MAG: ADP-ribosylglycohydrolase family protein, partial [Clostridia bacterium]|nr:ADP-ribosylglycohydrolase family protein [Clostridia bacterium]